MSRFVVDPDTGFVISSKNFTEKELMCKCKRCETHQGMNIQFMEKLQTLRGAARFRMTVSSAYRCPEHNMIESPKTGYTGPHTTRKAIDIKISGKRAHKLLTLALDLGFNGIGIMQKGKHHSRFIHLDILKSSTRP